MKGKVIVIEGTDGSGKATQTQMLYDRLRKESLGCRQLSFPRYGKPSAKLVEMYLAGDFGEDATQLDAYEVSKYYAIDRYSSYKEDWEHFYANGGIILADRYTQSNAIHQAAKLPKEERTKFFDWLYDLEFAKMGLPKPDAVIYLDMPLDATLELMREREESTNTKADLHERNTQFLAESKKAAMDAALYSGWYIVSCVTEGKLRSKEEIHESIYQLLVANHYI